MATLNLDFTGVDSVPTGKLYLQVAKVDGPKKSANKGTLMLTMDLVVSDVAPGADEAIVGRHVYDNLMLEGGALWRTKLALKALVGGVGDGPMTLDTAALVGKGAWCQVEEEEYEGQKRARIKQWGVKID